MHYAPVNDKVGVSQRCLARPRIQVIQSSQLLEVRTQVLVVALVNRLQRCARDYIGELAIGHASLVTKIPGLHRLIAGGLPPGLQNLFEPSFDVRRFYADGPGRRVDLGAVLCGIRSRHRDHSPVRTIRLVVSIDRLPQRKKGLKHRLAALRLFELVEQIETGHAIDRSALEGHAVADLYKAHHQRRSQGRIIQVLALPVTAVALGAERGGDGLRECLHLGPHSGNGFSIAFR